VLVDLVERDRRVHRRHVDEDVEPSHIGRGPIDERPRVRRLRKVGLIDEGAPAGCLHSRGD
jgi:hypothetical protein